jgi:DNA-binding beta-propeller fold protein YncE
MRTSSRQALFTALALAACAHAPSPARAEPSGPVETDPGVRWVAELPEPAAPPERSFLRRAWDAIVGAESAPAAPVAVERPFGVAVTRDRVAIADPEGPSVLAVAWPSRRTEQLTCPQHPWSAPIAVAFAPDGALYVADGAEIVRVGKDGCAAFGAEHVERPTGLAFAGGRLFAVDPPRHVVVAFSPEGEEVLRFGGHGEEAGQLNYPTAIAAAPDGTLLVVDALNFRVARFAADGRFLAAFGSSGEAQGAFGRPKAVAVDDDGRIFVSDVEQDAVLVFAADGTFERSIGRSGTGRGEFLLPAGLARSGKLLFVADSYNHRVQVLELLGVTS